MSASGEFFSSSSSSNFMLCVPSGKNALATTPYCQLLDLVEFGQTQY